VSAKVAEWDSEGELVYGVDGYAPVVSYDADGNARPVE
jgi:hypothetical protein